jgi:hypothetical protein
MRAERYFQTEVSSGWPTIAGQFKLMRFFLILLCVLPVALRAQVGVTTFGFQIKPIIPFSFLDPVLELNDNGSLSGSYELKGGLSFGMVIRVGLTKSLSIETGISQIRRRYNWQIMNDTAGYNESSELRWTGYELPVKALVYIRMTERIYMNNALGFSVDMYPSNVVRNVEDGQAFMYRSKNSWAQLGVVANVGAEYRTDKSGIIYLGATLHRPFTDMARAQLVWQDENLTPYPFEDAMNGSYLTIDIRYFFHEDPDKLKLRKSRGK